MKKLLLIGLSYFFTLILSAQSSKCAKALDRAEQFFEQGKLILILDRTENATFFNCLEHGGFTKEEEIRAYKLLTKVYTFSDDEAKAEETLVALLKADKEHQLSPADPAELHFLYSKYRTEPIIRVSFKFGANKTFISQIQEFNTFQSGNKLYNENGSGGLGLALSYELMLEKHLLKGIEIGLGAQLRNAKYEVDGQILTGGDLSYLVKNRSTLLRIPLLIRYNYGYQAKDSEGNRKKFIPYIFAGGSYDHTLDAKYQEGSRTGGTAFTLTAENNSLKKFDQVSKMNISMFGGLGFKYRVGRAIVDFLTIELRYDNSLYNYINPENRWKNEDVRFGIGHIEDDLTINTITFSVGYTKSFYLHRKRKEYR